MATIVDKSVGSGDWPTIYVKCVGDTAFTAFDFINEGVFMRTASMRGHVKVRDPERFGSVPGEGLGRKNREAAKAWVAEFARQYEGNA